MVTKEIDSLKGENSQILLDEKNIKIRLLHSKLSVKTKDRDMAFNLNEFMLLCLLHHA
jgi:hypothetical protein